MRDDVRRDLFDELDELVAVTGVDAPELGAAQAPAGRHEVDADDLRGPRPLLEQLRDPCAQLPTHPGDQDLHDGEDPCSGRRWGKRITSRIDWTPAISITNRSTPMPMPPVGGRPYSSART